MERSFADAPDSRIFWRPAFNPFVLVAKAEPVTPDHPDAFDLSRFCHVASALCCDDCEHVLFSDGARHLQLAIIAGSALDGPVRLSYALSGFQDVEAKALTLTRLCHLRRRGVFPRSLYPPETRAPRYAMMLRAWDGAQAGASQREIATLLYGEKAVRADWESGFLRTRAQRLIRGAAAMIGGGYERLLW